MRKILLTLFSLAFVAVQAQTTIVSQSFDEMNEIETIPGQSDDFDAWSCNDYGPDAVYTNTEQAFSGTKSMKITEDAANTTDMVLVLGPYTSDIYDITWKMYVPEGSGAYFNLMHTWVCNATSATGEWACDIFFHDNGSFDWRTEGTDGTATLPYPHNEWFDVAAHVDLPADMATLTIAGNPALSWQWSVDNNDGSGGTNQLNAVNFYGSSSEGSTDGLYYVDDILVQMTQFVGIESNSQVESSIYPNPANDKITIKGDFKNSPMRILDLTGKMVASELLNGQFKVVDTSVIPQGIYLLEIIQDGLKETKKLVITH